MGWPVRGLGAQSSYDAYPSVPGTYSVAWNGVDMGARPVASGVYLVSVKLPTRDLSTRVVLLK